MSNPSILHVSARPSHPGSEYRWLYVNIVFQVSDEMDQTLCDGYCSEFSRNILYEVEDVEQIHQHHHHTEYKFKPSEKNGLGELVIIHTSPEYDISDKIKHGWTDNPYHILRKAKKPGVYFYAGYVEDNAVTRASLSMFHHLRFFGKNNSRFVPLSTITRCIVTLDTFWD